MFDLTFNQFIAQNKQLYKRSITEQVKHYNQYLTEVAIYQQTVVNSVNSGQGAAEVVSNVAPSPSPSPSFIPPSVTPSITVSVTPTVTPSISVSVTPSVTPSVTVTPSMSEIPSVTPSVTITPSISETPSVTPSVTVTPSISETPSVTPSITVTVTPSISIIPSITPTPTPSPAVGRLNGIRILGSGNIIAPANTTIMANDIAALGYTAPNIVTTDLTGNTYTGADLDPAFDDIVIVYTSNNTNVSVGAPELADNLKTYLNNGGKILWTNYFPSNPPGGTSASFDYAITPFTASVNNPNVGAGGGTIGNISFEAGTTGHPILNGVTPNTNLAINLNSSVNILRTIYNTRPGASTIISFNSNSTRTPLVQTITYAGNRVSFYNNSTLSQGFSNSTANARRIISNTILWTAGMI